MQLNIHVPKERVSVVRLLEELSARTGRPKNELVLDALEAFLHPKRVELGRFHPGKMHMGSRAELYDRRLRTR